MSNTASGRVISLLMEDILSRSAAATRGSHRLQVLTTHLFLPTTSTHHTAASCRYGRWDSCIKTLQIQLQRRHDIETLYAVEVLGVDIVYARIKIHCRAMLCFHTVIETGIAEAQWWWEHPFLAYITTYDKRRTDIESLTVTAVGTVEIGIEELCWYSKADSRLVDSVVFQSPVCTVLRGIRFVSKVNFGCDNSPSSMSWQYMLRILIFFCLWIAIAAYQCHDSWQ